MAGRDSARPCVHGTGRKPYSYRYISRVPLDRRVVPRRVLVTVCVSVLVGQCSVGQKDAGRNRDP